MKSCWKCRHYFSAILGFVVILLALPLRADPASTIQTLMIVDQGDFLILQWSFYFVDFPNRFVLSEDHSKVIVLDNPSTLYANVSEIVSVGLDVKINGHSVRPDKISSITISPNKVCTVTMIYRGIPSGRLELRAPILKYLPATGMINYEILPNGHSDKMVSGNLIGHEGPFPEVITYQELSSISHSIPTTESIDALQFKAGFKSAWINLNWLFTCLVILLVVPLRKAVFALIGFTLPWLVLSLINIPGVPIVPELLLALPTSFLAVLAAGRKRWLWFTLGVISAAFLNAGHDLQQIQITSENALLSLTPFAAMGFACGLTLISLILYLLIRECKKVPNFELKWAPKICWIVAIISLLIPLQKMVFG